MATTKDSAFYAAIQTNKYPSDQRQSGGNPVRIPFEVTAAAPLAINDIINLLVIPANSRVVGLDCVFKQTTASATPSIGDSGSDVRFMLATAATINTHGVLAGAGAGYTPTVDTVVFMTTKGAALTAGDVINGYIDVIPAY